jgi:hypothetical protein
MCLQTQVAFSWLKAPAQDRNAESLARVQKAASSDLVDQRLEAAAFHRSPVDAE